MVNLQNSWLIVVLFSTGHVRVETILSLAEGAFRVRLFPFSLPLRLLSLLSLRLLFSFHTLLRASYPCSLVVLNLPYLHHFESCGLRANIAASGACPSSVPRTAVQDVPTPPRLGPWFPWEDIAAIASHRSISSRNRFQISSPFIGSLSLVIIWIAQFFVCIIDMNASCFAGTILPTVRFHICGFRIELLINRERLRLVSTWRSTSFPLFSCFIHHRLLIHQLILLMFNHWANSSIQLQRRCCYRVPKAPWVRKHNKLRYMGRVFKSRSRSARFFKRNWIKKNRHSATKNVTTWNLARILAQQLSKKWWLATCPAPRDATVWRFHQGGRKRQGACSGEHTGPAVLPRQSGRPPHVRWHFLGLRASQQSDEFHKGLNRHDHQPTSPWNWSALGTWFLCRAVPSPRRPRPSKSAACGWGSPVRAHLSVTSTASWAPPKQGRSCASTSMRLSSVAPTPMFISRINAKSVKLHVVSMSASWLLVSTHLIWIWESKLILSNYQSRATLWVLEIRLLMMIIASLSSNTYNKASWCEVWTFEGTESIF